MIAGVPSTSFSPPVAGSDLTPTPPSPLPLPLREGGGGSPTKGGRGKGVRRESGRGPGGRDEEGERGVEGRHFGHVRPTVSAERLNFTIRLGYIEAKSSSS